MSGRSTGPPSGAAGTAHSGQPGSGSLDEIGWSHVTGSFRALNFTFSFRTNEPELGRLLEHLYAPCSDDGQPDVIYSVINDPTGEGAAEICVGDRRSTDRHEPSEILNFLTWHINREVITRSGAFLLLHAAAAVSDGVAVLLPGVAEAGKTTLVTGLIRSGFDYLTDEAAAVRPSDLVVEPYPKPLTIDPGSWAALPDLAPDLDDALADLFVSRWYVNPQRIRADAIAQPAAPALVVFPTYAARATTSVQPVAGTDALVLLMQQTFGFNDAASRNLQVLGRLVQQASCYRLVSGDLEAACAAVQELAAGVTTNSDEGPPG